MFEKIYFDTIGFFFKIPTLKHNINSLRLENAKKFFKTQILIVLVSHLGKNPYILK